MPGILGVRCLNVTGHDCNDGMPVSDNLIQRSCLKRAKCVDVPLLEVAMSVCLERSIKIITFGNQIEDFVVEGADFMARQGLFRLGKNSGLSKLGLDDSQVLRSRHAVEG